MQKARIAIIGGGLAGLYAATLLEQMGRKDYVLLEARETWGGRIASASVANALPHDRFDLGPAWFWPSLQPQLSNLIDMLCLERFMQFEEGDSVVEQSSDGAPARMQGYASSPASMRLKGGMCALTDALGRRLPPKNLIPGQSVRRLQSDGVHVNIQAQDAQGQTATYCVEHVLLAVPPRLALNLIEFSPPLPVLLERTWRGTATWMAPHAKYVAVFQDPFWRAQGLSGGARSARGPLSEIHDASMPGGGAALSGFFGLPARVRRDVPEEALRKHCRAQLARLFGQQAGMPLADFIKDWALDPWTATTADLNPVAMHGLAPTASAAEGLWGKRITGIASEWSPHFPGYLAGAVAAAAAGVNTVSAQQK